MKLEDIHKDNIFKVPDNYFEDFSDRLHKRIAEKETVRTTPVIRMRTLINIAAAAVILIFAIYGISHLSTRSSSVDRILSDISSEELINYLVDSDMSTDELLESLDISIIASIDDPLTDELISSDPIDEEIIDDLIDEYEIEMEYL
jgi:hypothetical protein